MSRGSLMKPYQCWLKQDGIAWRSVFESHNPSDVITFASNNVVHGNNVERIEVRDLTGVLRTVYDRSWQKESK